VFNKTLEYKLKQDRPSKNGGKKTGSKFNGSYQSGAKGELVGYYR